MMTMKSHYSWSTGFHLLVGSPFLILGLFLFRWIGDIPQEGTETGMSVLRMIGAIAVLIGSLTVGFVVSNGIWSRIPVDCPVCQLSTCAYDPDAVLFSCSRCGAKAEITYCGSGNYTWLINGQKALFNPTQGQIDIAMRMLQSGMPGSSEEAVPIPNGKRRKTRRQRKKERKKEENGIQQRH